MKNIFCLFERPFKIQKNGVFLFKIFFFISEINFREFSTTQLHFCTLTFHHHPPLLSQILVLLPFLQVVCPQICPLNCSVHMSCFLDQKPIVVKKEKTFQSDAM